MEESIAVLFQAALLGRTDIVKNAVASIRADGLRSAEEVATIISSGRPDDNVTALHIASSKGHSDVVRALLNIGADPSIVVGKKTQVSGTNISEHFLGKKPYEVATGAAIQAFHVYFFEQIAMGNLTTIRGLLDGGVNVNLCDGSKLNDTTIHWACSFGNVEVVKLLLSYDIDVNVKNNEGESPLHIACKSANEELVNILLQNGADSTMKDNSGKYPIDRLTKENTNITQLLKSPPITKVVTETVPINANNSANDLPPNVATANHEEDGGGGNHVNFKSNGVSLQADDTIHGEQLSTEFSEPYESCESEDDDNIDVPSLVLWPPPQHQRVFPSATPLTLLSSEVLHICTADRDIDVLSLFAGCGLVDLFDKLGFQLLLQRSAHGAKIHLTIDDMICPGRHRYELAVDISSGIRIAASDRTGLLYALYTLSQLLQLHASVAVIEPPRCSITLPSLSITDWPDIPNRAAIWSYQCHARTSPMVMRRAVKTISKMRMNQLFLLLDCLPDNNSNNNNNNNASYNSERESGAGVSASIVEGKKPPHVTIPTNISSSSGPTSRAIGNNNEKQPAASRITSLDEHCSSSGIDLLPALTISSSDQKLPIDLLRNFVSTTLCLIFHFPEPPRHKKSDGSGSVGNGISTTTTTAAAVGGRPSIGEGERDDRGAPDERQWQQCRQDWVATCRRVFGEAQRGGFRSVLVSCSPGLREWLSPLELAWDEGLSASFLPLTVLSPRNLTIKTFLNQYEIITSVEQYTVKVHEKGSPVAVLPLESEGDFAYPFLFKQFHCFVFGGFSWNRRAVSEMVGPDRNMADLNEIITALLLPSLAGTATSQALLSLLTGFSALYAAASTYGLSAPPAGHEASVEPSRRIGRAEQLLWAILMSTGDVQKFPVPSKPDVAECSKYYRLLLAQVKWKARDVLTQSRSPVDHAAAAAAAANDLRGKHLEEEEELVDSFSADECFPIIHLLSILCRAILLAYNAHEKNTTLKSSISATGNSNHSTAASPLTVGVLMSELHPGIKSDLANAFLEAIELCHDQWSRRFDVLKYCSNKSKVHNNNSRISNDAISYVTSSNKNDFLYRNRTCIPAKEILQCVTFKLPITVEEILLKAYTADFLVE